ncbi:MAG: hypothetical protein H6732_18505 [Alphaproteobacteria bacterium]|nr:hypothetical protein [Alphaproteobacteria bacterium]
MSLLPWVLAGLAAAQPVAEGDTDVPEPEVPSVEAVQSAPVEEDVDFTVIVTSRERLLRAREMVLEQARAAGYVREVRRDGRTILRHDDPWKGELVLHDDGELEFKRQPVRFEPVLGKGPAAWITCVIPLLCLRAGGQTVGKRKLGHDRRAALAAVMPEVRDYTDAIADYAIDAKVDELPDQLAALWERGVPLDDGPRLESWEARREALFRFWDSRTDTEWGARVQAAIASFVRAEVQTGPHPYTAEELDRFDRERRSLRPFDVVRRAPPPDPELDP